MPSAPSGPNPVSTRGAKSGTNGKRAAARGAKAAVLVPVEDWRRLQQSARPTLKALLLADAPRAELPLPTRGKRRRRAPRAIA